jgi:hypothetical protein
MLFLNVLVTGQPISAGIDDNAQFLTKVADYAAVADLAGFGVAYTEYLFIRHPFPAFSFPKFY